MNETIQLTKSEKINIGTTEIAKRIRTQLKEFKGCKFSVTSKSYSMGSSITVSLMECNLKVIKDFRDIPDKALLDYGQRNYSEEQIKEMQSNFKYHQLSQFNLRQDFDMYHWCNGIFLTEEAHNLFKEVVKIVDYYNYDDSDSQTDLYDVNFAFHISIGKWDKNFEGSKQ